MVSSSEQCPRDPLCLHSENGLAFPLGDIRSTSFSLSKRLSSTLTSTANKLLDISTREQDKIRQFSILFLFKLIDLFD